jgi:hypothetical protein
MRSALRDYKHGLLSSFNTCESCLFEKMTKAFVTGQSERASDLMTLVYTDVCGPMSYVSRGGFQ